MRAGPLTALGRHQAAAEALPGGTTGATDAVQGLLIHEHMPALYDVELDAAAREVVQLRPVEGILDAALALDPSPLGQARPPGLRAAGNCRQVSVVTVALLRAQGTPARARCGFADYFGTGAHEDHWVVERFSPSGGWTLLDAQIDQVQRSVFPVTFDPADVPRDRFLVAGAAWQLCQRGEADPATFGLTFLDEAGLWWIAANMMRDAAALVGPELLPWDIWGAMPTPEEPISEDLVTLFDELARLTVEPDAHLDEIDRLVAHDERLHIPDEVFNASREVWERWRPRGAVR